MGAVTALSIMGRTVPQIAADEWLLTRDLRPDTGHSLAEWYERIEVGRYDVSEDHPPPETGELWVIKYERCVGSCDEHDAFAVRVEGIGYRLDAAEETLRKTREAVIAALIGDAP